MAVPKRKKSKSCTGMRKSANMAHGKVRVSYVEDPVTGELKLPHHVTKTGFYKGRNVFEKPAAAAE